MKNFTNNFKQFTSRLSARWLIMALMMLVGTSSAWAYCTSYNGNYKVYFDASTIKFAEGKTVNLMFEKSDGSGGVTMSQVSGTRYLYLWNSSDWGSCNVTKLAFFLADGAWGWEGNKLDSRKGYALAATNIHTLNSNISSNCLFSGNLTRTSNYTLPTYTITLNIVGSGSVTIKNNAGTALISGATANTSKSGVQYLTYLKNITATPAAGSKLSSIKIGSNDYTDAYKSGSDTNDGYDLTGNVTITVTFEQDCITPNAPFGGEAQLETICKGSPYEFDSNYKWYTGSTGETTVSGSEEINSNTDYYIVNVAPEGCESARTKYTINVDEPLVAPTLIPTNPTTCNGNPTAGSIVIENYANYSNEISFALYKDENPTDIAYNNGFAISEEGSYKVVMTTSASNVCGQSVETEPISIEIVDVTPTVTPFAITKQENVCMGNPVTLSYDGTAQSGTISYAWYEGDSDVVLGTEATLTIQQAKNATYKLVVTVTSNDCSAPPAEATTTVEPKAVPSAPTFDKYEMDACVNQQFTLPMPNNLKYEEEPLWTVDGLPTTASQTINVDGEYTYTAYKNDGCPSQGTPFTVRVNPLPTINIGENVTAVKFEDVVLTATGNNIDDVTWTADKGTITKDATDPKRAVLTYDHADAVIVTATATSAAGCTSVSATKTVTFSAENCTPVTSKDIKITFKTPSNNGNNGQYWGIGSLYYKKDNGASYTEVKLYENDNCQGGEQTSQEVTISNLQNNATVYFKACYDYGGYTATTKKLTLTKGNKYIIGIISNQNPSSTNNTNKTSEVGIEVTSEVSLTQDPPIIAPAVKMISAEYDEENDVIVAKGAVYKTGCGETFWGFQYSRNGQTWGTTDEYFIRPNTGNSLSVPGEFEHSFTIPDANGGETYYIRAYALNNYNNDSYSLSSAVYSTTSLPVEIPSKTIESATISLVDSEGKESDVTEVCPQSTVYLKVSYAGGDFTDFVAEENFPGTDLELVNHDKTNNYAIFSFTATAAGTANITISNKSGSTVTPADGVSITLKDVQVVTPPIITINPESAMICQGDDATISIVEENQNYTYTIYKDGEALNPQSFTITEAGVYTVGATENECNTSATSMPIELKVVSSDVKIGLEADNTAIGPWQPLKLTVTPAKGYEYTLEGLDGMVYTKEGDVYTIKIPRPNDWSPGNSGTQLETENKVFTAKIKVSDEVSCGSKEVTVTLTDTEENCE